LAVTDLAERARVLARDADRVATELRETGVVDDPRLRLDHSRQDLRQPLPHRLPRPRALVEKLLQALLIAILEPRRHRLNRLPLPVQQQPAHVALAPTPLI